MKSLTSPWKQHFLFSFVLFYSNWHQKHGCLLTFASIDGWSDVWSSEKVGNRHDCGEAVAVVAVWCDMWLLAVTSRNNLLVIPPPHHHPVCQKPPVSFCLLSPAADHLSALNAGIKPEHRERARLCFTKQFPYEVRGQTGNDILYTWTDCGLEASSCEQSSMKLGLYLDGSGGILRLESQSH